MPLRLILLVISLILASSAAPVSYNGKEITPQIQSITLQILKTSYTFNGGDLQKNCAFIRKSLEDTFPGSWNVVITIYNIYGDYESSNYSMSNEWWMKWYGVNPYRADWTYGMQRVAEQYDPKELIQGQWYNLNYTSDGFTSQQKSIIANIISTRPNAQEMSNLLNQNIMKGNWNSYYRIYNYNTRFSIYAKDGLWFSYTTKAYNPNYLVYAS